MTGAADIDEFRAGARAWLEANARLRTAVADPASAEWGVGSDNVAVFHALPEEVERERLLACRRWQQAKFDAGYAMINWPEALGGRGLPNSYLRAYNAEESRFELPNGGELPPTSMGLIAPTVAAYGTPEQQQRFIRPLLRQDEWGCQLFSEPSAGSDLASLSTRAVADGDEWVVNGQKVWISRIQHSDLMILLARTTPLDEVKKKADGLSIFLVDLHAAIGKGMEIRPIRNMVNHETNEVFFEDVLLPADALVGEVGKGFRYVLDGMNAASK